MIPAWRFDAVSEADFEPLLALRIDVMREHLERVFRYKASRAYRKFQTNLYGAEVSIYYVQRQSGRAINSADHIRFWAEWIRDNNGRLKQATKLQGVG